MEIPQECSYNGTELAEGARLPIPTPLVFLEELIHIHSLALAAAIASSSRRYWKDHFSQTNSAGGWGAEAPSHLLCIPKPDSITHGGIFWNMLLRRLYSSLSAGISCTCVTWFAFQKEEWYKYFKTFKLIRLDGLKIFFSISTLCE